jgi:hypothetical protein
MVVLSKPEKPLKILTIDGGGLQAISNLVILNKLLDAIASNNKAKVKPRPCDIFDTIAGIGAGGWLALLLGRFHLDIPACLTEWYNLIECITPRSRIEEVCMRILHHCYVDMASLIQQIDRLTKIYGTTERMFYDESGENTGRPRCKHVFVAALNQEGQKLDYKLFRTYNCPKGAKVREGPKNPSTFKISHAFAVTGAAKYFTNPWKEAMASSGLTKFMDNKFPKPHNITELALDEMWGLYGTDVEMSVIVNVGPGIPNGCDVKQIASRFSWGLSLPTMKATKYPNRRRASAPDDARQPTKEAVSKTHSEVTLELKTSSYAHSTEDLREPRATRQTPGEAGRKGAPPRMNTFGSIMGRGIDMKLRRLENEIEADIRKKLTNVYRDNVPPYYRLAPDESPPGTAQNDASARGVAFNATLEFLKTPRVSATIEEIRERIPWAPPGSEHSPCGPDYPTQQLWPLNNSSTTLGSVYGFGMLAVPRAHDSHA